MAYDGIGEACLERSRIAYEIAQLSAIQLSRGGIKNVKMPEIEDYLPGVRVAPSNESLKTQEQIDKGRDQDIDAQQRKLVQSFPAVDIQGDGSN